VTSAGLRFVGRAAIDRYIRERPNDVLDVVLAAYRAHWRKQTVCPESVFLRLPGGNRIIALPAYLADDGVTGAGVKWIASFPGNVAVGMSRASALILLNDLETGYTSAVLEGAAISAARTGAFAALACDGLLRDCARPKVGVVGCGPIASAALSYLGLVLDLSEIRAFDLVDARAQAFAASFSSAADVVRTCGSLDDALAGTDVALFATTAPKPYLDDATVLAGCKVVLHVSLRDISERVLSQCFNVSDDRAHVLREETSLHRLARSRPGTEAVDADLGDVLWGGVAVPRDTTVVFSPFGLGVLDIALASSIFANALEDGTTTTAYDFYDHSM
jgi:N-[(2S)-2-amino-2-carboxyethyl]-L-glutamate dehydrogenase